MSKLFQSLHFGLDPLVGLVFPHEEFQEAEFLGDDPFLSGFFFFLFATQRPSLDHVVVDELAHILQVLTIGVFSFKVLDDRLHVS
jgi:hypothetical protein